MSAYDEPSQEAPISSLEAARREIRAVKAKGLGRPIRRRGGAGMFDKWPLAAIGQFAAEVRAWIRS